MSGGVLSGVLDEGDSISAFWSGNHTGIFAILHPTVTFNGRAVGGSTLVSMAARFDTDAVFKPKVVTILIGANDVYSIGSIGSKYVVTSDYLNALFAYAAKWRATGAKVLVGTVLGQCQAGNPNNVNDRQNVARVPVNAGIRMAIGTKIDGVIDYAADPVMGTDAAACDTMLFQDGVHPTEGLGLGIGGQGKLAAVYAPVVEHALK
ncbi:MAG: SGNH/GDSL hydrolase family protein [Sphingomonas sp.]